METNAPPDQTHVLVIANAGVVRLGLQAILERTGGLRVRAVSGDANSVEEVLQPTVSVVVVSSAQAPLLLRQHADTVPFVVVAETPTDVMIVDLFAAGARGLVLAESAPDLLAGAVRAVRNGHLYIDPRAAHALVAMAVMGRRNRGPFGLTAREQRVLTLMMDGGKNREIAEQLGISPETVKSHVRSVMTKLGAVDRHHAVETAREFGLP